MKRFRIKLKFTSPLHIGYKEGAFNLTETIIHSDTIFSGIINCHSLLYGKDKTDNLINEAINGNFKVSSAFYYINDEYLYPRPVGMNFKKYVDDFKKEKKINYVSEEILFGNTKEAYLKDNMLLKKDMKKNVYNVRERPRSTLDRITNASNIFYTSTCVFNEDCGLWFFMDAKDYIIEEIISSIKLLGDEGIGGDRTYGYGQFEFEPLEHYIEDIKDKNLLLSLCIPNEKDKVEDLIFYNIVERGGYIYSNYSKVKRHSLFRMIQEGSIVKGDFKGCIIDDTPEDFNYHKVYKYGRAFLIPLDWEG
ncbi:type III-A CRISPR-associated RAMP protein Csm4 [Caloramator sp. E03]|uniref:type III-A CRISPR-associated RAMP protein Csm4 n=1 Tax=Caloramator sp. E03 TaxID=2576307 RepID=UPI00143D258D|nr:type III-A CRISPR-associated RAMP protein Csm4 [Caloramator sp. E03]